MILLVFKSPNKVGSSVLGLGVNAYHTSKVLTDDGYVVDQLAVTSSEQIIAYLKFKPVDYCILEAPWLPVVDTINLTQLFPKTTFIIRCHSNLNFLQVEPQAIILLRELLLHSEMISNLKVAANSMDLVRFFKAVYHTNCVYLPNLYYYKRPAVKNKRFPVGTLKAGSFGAIRLQKNHITGAAAALMLARELGLNLEFFLTVGRDQGNGVNEVIKAISTLFDNVSWAKLTLIPWAAWPVFKRTIAEVDICFHLSSTETFNITTADALSEGVGVIGSPMIKYLPNNWKVNNTDAPLEAANLGAALLMNPLSQRIALKTILRICLFNLDIWRNNVNK